MKIFIVVNTVDYNVLYLKKQNGKTLSYDIIRFLEKKTGIGFVNFREFLRSLVIENLLKIQNPHVMIIIKYDPNSLLSRQEFKKYYSDNIITVRGKQELQHLLSNITEPYWLGLTDDDDFASPCCFIASNFSSTFNFAANSIQNSLYLYDNFPKEYNYQKRVDNSVKSHNTEEKGTWPCMNFVKVSNNNELDDKIPLLYDDEFCIHHANFIQRCKLFFNTSNYNKIIGDQVSLRHPFKSCWDEVYKQLNEAGKKDLSLIMKQYKKFKMDINFVIDVLFYHSHKFPELNLVFSRLIDFFIANK